MTTENNTTLSDCLDDLFNLHSAYRSLAELIDENNGICVNSSPILCNLNIVLNLRLEQMKEQLRNNKT